MRNPKLTSIIYNSISIVGNGLNECLSPIYLFLNIPFETSVETHLFTKAGCQHTGTDACSANFNKAGYILLICFESAQGWLHKVPHALAAWHKTTINTNNMKQLDYRYRQQIKNESVARKSRQRTFPSRFMKHKNLCQVIQSTKWPSQNPTGTKWFFCLLTNFLKIKNELMWWVFRKTVFHNEGATYCCFPSSLWQRWKLKQRPVRWFWCIGGWSHTGAGSVL